MKTVIALLVLALTTTPAWADNSILWGQWHADGVVPITEEMGETRYASQLTFTDPNHFHWYISFHPSEDQDAWTDFFFLFLNEDDTGLLEPIKSWGMRVAGTYSVEITAGDLSTREVEGVLLIDVTDVGAFINQSDMDWLLYVAFANVVLRKDDRMNTPEQEAALHALAMQMAEAWEAELLEDLAREMSTTPFRLTTQGHLELVDEEMLYRRFYEGNTAVKAIGWGQLKSNH